MANGVNLREAIEDKQNSTVSILSREEKFHLRWQMFNDNYKRQVLHRLKEIYEKVSIIKIDKQIDMTNNIYTSIVEKTARVYKFGTKRQFSNAAAQELYKDLRVAKIMDQSNTYLNALNDVLIQVAWNKKKDIPKLIFRLPHNTRVKLDENNEPYEVEYLVGKEEDKEKWACWTDSEHYYKIYKDNGKIEKESVNDGDINPFGRLPFLFMQNGFRDAEFFDQYTGDDMISITLDNAVYNTFKNYLIKWQSFKQLVITGNNVNAFDGQLLDPSSALTAEGEDVNIDILDLQSNLKELRETIDAAAEKVALNYNISPSAFRLSSQATSGFSKMMENAQLDEFTRGQQEDFEQYEKELYSLIVLVGEKNNKKYGGEFNIQITPPYYQESRQTEIDVYEKEISLGLTNPITILMNEKGIDEAEAKKQYEDNLQIRNQANERFNGTVPTTTLPINEGD